MVIKFLTSSGFSELLLYMNKNLFDSDKQCNSYNLCKFSTTVSPTSEDVIIFSYFKIFMYFLLVVFSKVLESLDEDISGTEREIIQQ